MKVSPQIKLNENREENESCHFIIQEKRHKKNKLKKISSKKSKKKEKRKMQHLKKKINK